MDAAEEGTRTEDGGHEVHGHTRSSRLSPLSPGAAVAGRFVSLVRHREACTALMVAVDGGSNAELSPERADRRSDCAADGEVDRHENHESAAIDYEQRDRQPPLDPLPGQELQWPARSLGDLHARRRPRRSHGRGCVMHPCLGVVPMIRCRRSAVAPRHGSRRSIVSQIEGEGPWQPNLGAPRRQRREPQARPNRLHRRWSVWSDGAGAGRKGSAGVDKGQDRLSRSLSLSLWLMMRGVRLYR